MSAALLLARARKNHTGAVTYATWNPADQSVNIVLSLGNTKASASSLYGLVRATQALSGKVYFELDYNAALTGNGSGSRTLAAGVCGSSLSVSTGQAFTSSDALECWGPEASCWTNGSSLGTLVSSSSSSRLRIAVDASARKVWMAISGTTNWLLGGDPAAGTTPTATLTGADALYAFAEPYSSPIILVSDPALMLNSPPSGFTAGF